MDQIQLQSGRSAVTVGQDVERVVADSGLRRRRLSRSVDSAPSASGVRSSVSESATAIGNRSVSTVGTQNAVQGSRGEIHSAVLPSVAALDYSRLIPGKELVELAADFTSPTKLQNFGDALVRSVGGALVSMSNAVVSSARRNQEALQEKLVLFILQPSLRIPDIPNPSVQHKVVFPQLVAVFDPNNPESATMQVTFRQEISTNHSVVSDARVPFTDLLISDMLPLKGVLVGADETGLEFKVNLEELVRRVGRGASEQSSDVENPTSAQVENVRLTSDFQVVTQSYSRGELAIPFGRSRFAATVGSEQVYPHKYDLDSASPQRKKDIAKKVAAEVVAGGAGAAVGYAATGSAVAANLLSLVARGFMRSMDNSLAAPSSVGASHQSQLGPIDFFPPTIGETWLRGDTEDPPIGFTANFLTRFHSTSAAVDNMAPYHKLRPEDLVTKIASEEVRLEVLDGKREGARQSIEHIATSLAANRLALEESRNTLEMLGRVRGAHAVAKAELMLAREKLEELVVGRNATTGVDGASGEVSVDEDELVAAHQNVLSMVSRLAELDAQVSELSAGELSIDDKVHNAEQKYELETSADQAGSMIMERLMSGYELINLKREQIVRSLSELRTEQRGLLERGIINEESLEPPRVPDVVAGQLTAKEVRVLETKAQEHRARVDQAQRAEANLYPTLDDLNTAS